MFIINNLDGVKYAASCEEIHLMEPYDEYDNDDYYDRLIYTGFKHKNTYPKYSYTAAQLRCDFDTKIVIIKADFGRDKYSSACGNYFDGECKSFANATEIAKKNCGNKRNCDLISSTQIFSDPCYGQQKILRVWYQCVGDGTFFKLLKNEIKTNLFVNKVLTTGGNSNGKACRFPFKYKNVEHYQCTYEDTHNFNNKKWCRTNEDSALSLEWGNCPSMKNNNFQF